MNRAIAWFVRNPAANLLIALILADYINRCRRPGVPLREVIRTPG